MGEAVNAITKPLQTVTQGVMGALDPLGIGKQAGKAMGATPLGGMMGDMMEDPEKALAGGALGPVTGEAFKTAKKNKNASTLLTGGLNRY